ncbi:MAG: PSD1 and planctomycete cytochrome C domain-containing protein [Acidobacteriota bacterium]|nr:PSD1 and planctomycete cytochrome C domain-containing protein [Acidobacteriota bacterium]
MHDLRSVACLSVLLVATSLRAQQPGTDSLNLFETKIRPVLVARCYACHSAKLAKPQGGLLLDSQAAIKRGGNSGAAIEPGDPEKSLLVHALRYQDKELQMPPGKPLPPEQVSDFENWIRSGAAMPADVAPVATVDRRREFWSFQRPKDHAPPEVKRKDWPRNEIDNFILSKLEQKGISPSAPADKRTLIRRAYFDLTGLPPTADEADAFVADKSSDAYPRLVDRLLASPRYGERWGRFWLDVARYSDARNVGERFAYSYTYRDWVIRAFNEDMPYSQFLTQQLAADRIKGNDARNLAALGYLSLGREFPKTPAETVDDRIDVVARGMLGLTVACARCHDHKYDPIPTKDYYSFYSIFSNIREPEDLPLLKTIKTKTPVDAVYGERLARIRKTDADYRENRSAVLNTFFRTQTAEYLIATRDSTKLRSTEVEELIKERQLNLHLLGRWKEYLAASRASKEPVFALWNAAAEIPDAEFAARWPDILKTQSAGNPLVFAEFKTPPASLKDVAARYAAVLTRYDSSSKLPDADQEALRLALRGSDAPVNVPVSEFDLVMTEGDRNNTINFKNRYNTMRALYSFDGGAPRAMAMEDVPHPEPAHVFVRGNPNNLGIETPAHFLSCLSSGDPAIFRDGSGRLELAKSITSKDNPLTARVIVNRVWLHHFGAGIVRTPSDFGLRGDLPTHPELLDHLAVKFMESGWSLKKLHRTIMLSAAYQQRSLDNPEARKLDPENQLLWRMNRQRLDIEGLRDSMLAASGQLDLRVGGVPFAITAAPAVPRRTLYAYIERGRIPGMLAAFDFASPDQHVPLRYATTVPQQALFLLNSSFMAEQARRLMNRPEIVREVNPAKRVEELYRLVLGRDATPEEAAAGVKFINSATQTMEKAGEASPWQYGIGEYDAATDRVKTFTPFKYFTGDSWQGASMLPDPMTGKAMLRGDGGEPGDTSSQAAIRRWVSPVEGKISIEGTLRHDQNSLGSAGDGVRARIISSRSGELASWNVNGSSAETKLNGIKVEKGDTLDFIVDSRADTENDGFRWAPTVKMAGVKETAWSASADFRGPVPRPMTAWERYGHVLLQTNEFAFVD